MFRKYEKVVFISFFAILLYAFLAAGCFAADCETAVESLWAVHQKIVQTYSDWKDGQEVEFEEINKKWVLSGIKQTSESVQITGGKQEFMKCVFPKDSNYTLTLVADATNNIPGALIGLSYLVVSTGKKFFNSKVEIVDMHSDRISGGLFNLDSKRVESLKSFLKKNSEKENFCSFLSTLLVAKKSDFSQRQDGKWQINIRNSITGRCPFAQREKTFERKLTLVMPYSFQPDLSKIKGEYIDISRLVSPVNVIIESLLINDFFEWLRKEMQYRGIQI